MRIRLVVVGKLKEAHFRAAVDDYLARAKHYVSIEEIELKDDAPAALAIAMRKAIPDRSRVVAMVIDGKQKSSEELAAFVESHAAQGNDLTFVIGGADGIPAEIVARAHDKLSLSRMTLPHRLARLVLVEQIYRAMTIRKGEPYHH
jgi:23S rRNA (pseudouridine1915-N3)-methyltransferase